ncbi:MAG: FKBP-type peptidyl-prolyl cis-trans isomerase [Patescibacteria group bacterium]|nr:FKBP-type peptidyl-prolyl cis-trans isomerase [Patescibacteria group bacterium]
MSKTKIFVGVGVGLLVLGAGGGAYAYVQHQNAQVNQVGSTSESQSVSNAVPVDTTASNTDSSIPLNQAPTGAASDGLTVQSVTAENSAMQAAGTANAASQSSQAGQSGSNGRNPFDPTTFAQYDKYKDGKGGLYGDVAMGNGTTLAPGKKAAVYYRGWLTNGTKFDESRAGSDGKLAPFIFTLGSHQVITGWEDALVGMKVGGVRLVIVPPAAGYGATAQNNIPANSVLVFQVQLADVQ